MAGTAEATTAQAAPVAATVRPGALRRFVLEHEDRWLFLILYVGSAVVLSTFVSLFWLAALVVVHFALEWVVHQKHHGQPMRTSAEAFWAVKLDVALVLFSLALTLYMNVLFGLIGLRSAAQVAKGTRIAARLPAWQRGVRSALLTVDDAAQVTRAAVSSARHTHAGHAAAERPPPPEPPGHRGLPTRIRLGDWVAILLGVACAALIALAPALSEHTWGSIVATFAAELRPFP